MKEHYSEKLKHGSLISDLNIFASGDHSSPSISSDSVTVTSTPYSLTTDAIVGPILQSKSEALAAEVRAILSDTQSTHDLQAKLLAYLDFNITKVENHLLHADFLQNKLGHDVRSLRSQMEQELFQLEQEKVRTHLQIHNQVLHLSRQLREALKELSQIETHRVLFGEHGRHL